MNEVVIALTLLRAGDTGSPVQHRYSYDEDRAVIG